MRTLGALSLLILCLLSTTHAQSYDEKISCYATRENANHAFKAKLWDGYEISLGPARNSTGDGDNCTAAIYNQQVKVVYRTTGFNVVFDGKATGYDFDNDGHPDVVFRTDTGGGNHCCWAINVISLWPKPHKLFDYPTGGAVAIKRDSMHGTTIWGVEPPPGGEALPRGPYAEKVYRFQDGKLTDVTPQFCSDILNEENGSYQSANDWLTPERIKTFESGEKFGPPDQQAFESSETEIAALTVALQHTFCHQFNEALSDFDIWPEATRNEERRAFAESIKDAYPELAAMLRKQNQASAPKQ